MVSRLVCNLEHKYPGMSAGVLCVLHEPLSTQGCWCCEKVYPALDSFRKLPAVQQNDAVLHASDAALFE